jgi:hypothetical protein
MKEVQNYLRNASFDEVDVCIPNTGSTFQDDREFLLSFLNSPADCVLDDKADDTFDRLIEERLNPLGVALVLKRVMIENWMVDGEFVLSDMILTYRICPPISGQDHAADPEFAQEVLACFTNSELKELQFYLSEFILTYHYTACTSDAFEIATRAEALKGVLDLLVERLRRELP